MPIYEYVCTQCGHAFEALVRGERVPACASCGATGLERRFSLPNVSSSSTKAQALTAARKRDQAQGSERMQEQLKYERSHND